MNTAARRRTETGADGRRDGAEEKPLLELRQVVKRFDTGAGTVHALEGVSLSIRRGETLGLVGESGCGKSTVARLVMDLYPPTSGTVHFDGKDIAKAGRDARKARHARLQMVFQDPFSSLNPRHRIGRTLEEPLIIHRRGNRKERAERVAWLLERVGLKPDAAQRYPHEFSGGQRQRIGIARALALRPELIVCDEAVSALDVSIRAQVLNLLLDLRKDYRVAYLFISHDLSIVRHMSDRVAVMYLGRIVEIAPRDDLWREPRHPYTRALMSAIPRVHPEQRNGARITLQGDLPSPLNPPAGCRFQTRCPFAAPRCRAEEPILYPATGEHWVACHFA
ncbi:ABC transporter ATP-binding protein [Pseudothauera rhizosphaerae]|uniref:Dipeptide ABC transporter ATP-binding protein n=1 Tax=Pseudothauera rhizosphaerae TaxID=2565932 RepID=A0A4S4AQV4_9RHOO|nr:dipeptide ABC transporter ATP-binding protein [Pseudothauera rhizosphaerae]THF62114.1 dipeptide ABC transporter ATP-binding protein [Pseudothauera rhizosphaerae]